MTAGCDERPECAATGRGRCTAPVAHAPPTASVVRNVRRFILSPPPRAATSDSPGFLQQSQSTGHRAQTKSCSASLLPAASAVECRCRRAGLGPTGLAGPPTFESRRSRCDARKKPFAKTTNPETKRRDDHFAPWQDHRACRRFRRLGRCRHRPRGGREGGDAMNHTTPSDNASGTLKEDSR